MISRYRCRFCWKEMVEEESTQPILKKGVDIGYQLRHVCKKCGVLLIEKVLSYSAQQIKDYGLGDDDGIQ